MFYHVHASRDLETFVQDQWVADKSNDSSSPGDKYIFKCVSVFANGSCIYFNGSRNCTIVLIISELASWFHLISKQIQ